MRFVDADEISSVLTFPTLIAALEAADRRPKMQVQDGFLGTEREQYFVRHAVDRGRYFASKLITSFPANLAGGKLPAVQAVCILFDGTDGRPLAVMDGTEITYWRTAADSALGAKLLAPPDPRTMLVVGAGQMSRWLIRAHRCVRPSIQRVLIWNRTPQRAADVAAALVREQIDAEAIDDLEGATRAADIISTCTRSHVPLVKGIHVKAGTHLDLVGGYTPDTREADDVAARRASIFVDRRESAFAGVGDILQPLANGSISEADVLGDLYDLVSGSIPGRRSPGEITLFKNAGGGHLDLMTAETVYRQLEAKGC
jgi:ornithine cyclodeaminase/alanine dehydrogenase-like protein (mu-crystallin family)